MFDYSALHCLVLYRPIVTLCCPLVAQDRTCSVVPANQPATAGETHELTCFAKPRTIIISWKMGLDPRAPTTAIVYQVDISGSIEATNHAQAAGFSTDYDSLRRSTMKITSVTLDNAGFAYCCALDMISKEMFYCASKLNVFGKTLFVNLSTSRDI